MASMASRKEGSFILLAMFAVGQSATPPESLNEARFRLEFGVEVAETFLWTSPANEACVVEAERQPDL
jgi:hypothetical protein